MTASDIPLTTGQTDNGGEGMRFLGYTVYDGLINWDLSSAELASDLVPGLATLIAWLTIDEVPPSLTFVGGALAIVGVLMTRHRPKKA